MVQKSANNVDIGLIIINEEESKKLNPNMIPEDYFIIKLK